MQVKHQEEQGRFVLELNGAEAELTYQTVAPGILDYNHTFVPPDLRGAGAGGKLVRYALDHARKAGYKVRPSCSFVAAFMRRFPEYGDLRSP